MEGPWTPPDYFPAVPCLGPLFWGGAVLSARQWGRESGPVG